MTGLLFIALLIVAVAALGRVAHTWRRRKQTEPSARRAAAKWNRYYPRSVLTAVPVWRRGRWKLCFTVPGGRRPVFTLNLEI